MKSWVLNVKTVNEKEKQDCSLFCSSLWIKFDRLLKQYCKIVLNYKMSELTVLFQFNLKWHINQDAQLKFKLNELNEWIKL